MSSNYFERQAFPHEDDATFERTLRNISLQEVMPRPLKPTPSVLEATQHSEFFTDTWHWEDIGLLEAWPIYLRYLKNLTYSTLMLGLFKYLSQPVARPLILLATHFKDIVKYTLLMDPPVPLRFQRLGGAHVAWMTVHGWETTLRSDMVWAFKNFFLRAPVFTLGTYIGSKLVWALEDWKGEDAMVNSRMPIMVASGFATYAITFHRNRFTNFARAPMFVFLGTFMTIWYIDGFYLRKAGFDAFWNPLGLKLPHGVVQLLVGDPFNGDIILGPIKYAGMSLATGLGKTTYWLKEQANGLLGNDRSDDGEPPSPSISNMLWNASTHSYADSIEKNIEELEKSALVSQGFLPDSISTSRNVFDRIIAEKKSIEDGFDRSVLNPMNHLTAYNDRLSSRALSLVEFLWGKDSELVLTPYLAPKSTNEIIFGNLTTGIEQSGSMEHVESVRKQLEANANSSSPSLLGPASKPGFFALRHMEAARISTNMVNDPIGALLTPVARFFQGLTGWYFLRAEYAFDDQRASLGNKPRWSVPSSSRSVTTPVDSPPAGWSSDPLPLELPPLIPHSVAQRQTEAYLASNANKAPEFSWEETSESLSTLIQEDLPEILGDSVSAASSMASTLWSGSHSSTTSSIEDELSAIKKQVDSEVEARLPKGVTSETRLQNFVQNIGGADFEEPTEIVAQQKMARHRARRWYNLQSTPIVGQRKRAAMDDIVSSLKRTRQHIANTVVPQWTSMVEASQTKIELERKELDSKRQIHIDEFNRRYVTPLKDWFAEMKSQLFSQTKS